MNTIGDIPPKKTRIVRILNTLKLEEMLISEAMLPEAEQMDNVGIIGSPEEVAFDAEGNLV